MTTASLLPPPLLSRSLRWGLRALCLLGAAGITVEGREHVPRRGPVIFAANHRSYIDAALLWAVLPRPTVFIATVEVRHWPLAHPLMTRLRQIYVNHEHVLSRDHPYSGLQAMRRAEAVLRQGGSIGIFPEGEGSRSGYLLPLRQGVARLALTTDTPIVPVGIVGAVSIWPPGGRFQWGHGAHIRFGEPISASGFSSTPGNRRALIHRLAHDLCDLSGQVMLSHPDGTA
jgi:1-acyl-sn-glycerol-3-phosphate acyltransferase